MTNVLDSRAKLAGKAAAIIGAGGIAAPAALALAESGVDLAICDIDAAALADVEKAARGLGRNVSAMCVDATDPLALSRFYRMIATDFNRLDIVVNVVGGVKRKALMEFSATEIANDIQRNYGYIIQSVREAVPLIRRSGTGGSIINFTTIEAHRGAAGFAVYAGAKAATTNFTRAMAVELGAEHIRLNCIAPDTTPSQGNYSAMPASMGEAFASLPDRVKALGMNMYIPLQNPPPASALADAVLFLASDLSAFVSGTTLHVDGGTMAAAGFLNWPFGDGFVPVPLAGTLARMYRDSDGT